MKELLIGTLAFAAALTRSPEVTHAQPARAPSRIDSTAMLQHVRVLAHDSLQGRRTGTPGGAKARDYVAAKLAGMGIGRLGESYVFPFTFQAGSQGAATNAFNVLGVVRGKEAPNRYIVLSAHFDHLGEGTGDIFNGADDNASGTGVLLAIAAYLQQNAPRNSIIVAALDAEERGLRGAREFVANPPVPIDSVVLNVNMDMVGRNDRDELYTTGTLHYPFLKQYVEQAQAKARVKLLMGHDNVPPGGRPSDDWTNSSDHGPFHSRRIPFLYFGVEDHPDYHRPSDEFERLQPGFYVRAAESILDALLILDANLSAIAAARK